MEIKIKLEEVIKINNALASIIDDNQSKINVLLKFRLLSLMKSIEPYVSNFEIIKNEKIIEYGKKNKDGVFQISKDDSNAMTKFTNDITQVLNSEISINMEPFKPSEIFNQGLKAEYLKYLFPLIRE